MFLYNLTLAPPSAILMAIVGNFSGTKMQEIITASNSQLSLLKADPASGKVIIITSFNTFGIIRSISPFRLPGSTKDYIVVGSDSGRIAILEYVSDKNTFSAVHMETFGKSGCRRIVPGQYVAVDPKGRAVMISAVEKSKFVYILNRDVQSNLTISSPLEAHKSHIITWDIIGVDVGFENPSFACIELDYSESDQDPSGEAYRDVIKALTFYELDLGLNHVVRKWSEEIDLSAHKLITVPGGSDGPSGVLVCSENYITWMHPDYSTIRIPIPRRPELYDINQDLQNGVKEEKGIIVISSVVHRLKNGFFVLVQTEQGDVFKITMDYTPGTDGFGNGVDTLKIKYFDTLPPSSSLILLKSGFLFAASEFGNHTLYQIENLGDDDEEQIEFSTSDMDEDNSFIPFFSPRPLRNIVPVDEMESLAPIMDAKVQNLTNEETPQVHVLCGQGARSTFRILKHGLEISEMAVSELPGNPNSVWTVKSSAEDPYDAFIIVSFVNATLVLSIGDTVEEVTDTGFLLNTSTLAVAQMGEDALVQIYPSGIRHIRSDRRVSEWRTAANRPIEKAACNRRQVVISLSGGELVYFELDSSGQLNEFQERKEMTANVLCLSLGPIPEGRQRSRFLAVGCADNTVRMISLDPDSCLQSLSMQALTSTAESLAITNSLDPATGIPTLYLNIGLQNGIFLKTVLDNVTGALSDSKLRFLGSRPVKLFKLRISDDDAVLALSSRPWLSYNHNRRSRLMPLSYQMLEYGAPFSTESCLEGMVAISGNSLRILSADKLDSVFNQTIIPLKYTPRKQVFDEKTKTFIIIEADNNTFSPSERKKRLITDDLSGELPVEQFGLPVAGLGNWASCLRIISPLNGETNEFIELEDNEAAFSVTLCEFKNYPGDRFLILGTAKGLQVSPRKCIGGYMHVYRLDTNSKLSLMHITEVEDAPLAMMEFHGRLLVGIGKHVRIYELGMKKLLRKCESLEFPNLIVGLNAEVYRIIVSDIKESTHYIAYKQEENKFVLFADDSTTRWITCTTMLDYGTVVGADKFGNVFINRIPLETTEDVEEDPTGSRMVYTRGYLQGAALKADHLVEFYVGDTVTSISRTSLAPGGREVLLYTTIHGGVGILVPFVSKDDVEIFRTLEMALRNEIPPLCGRDHAAFRSSYFPVKGVVDGDLCELYNTLPNEKKRQIAEMVDRNVTEVSKKLEDARNRVAF